MKIVSFQITILMKINIGSSSKTFLWNLEQIKCIPVQIQEKSVKI